MQDGREAAPLEGEGRTLLGAACLSGRAATFFQNRTELIEPLGGDLRIADRNHPATVARLRARIDEARQLLPSASSVANTAPMLRELTTMDKEEAAWAHYSASLAATEQKRAELPTTEEIEAERDRLMQRLDAGEADVGRNRISMFNVYADYELKAGARQFDRNLRVRRLAALRSAIATGETRFVASAVDEFVEPNPKDSSSTRSSKCRD